MIDEDEQWRECIEPQGLLDLIRSRSSPRKLRLVACAYARNVWHLLTDERSRKAVDIAERFADGECAVTELLETHEEAAPVAAMAHQRDPKSPATRAARLAVACTHEDAYTAAYVGTFAWRGTTRRHPEFREQTPIFRELYGNPFIAWRIESGSPNSWGLAPIEMARAIYAERDFLRLPELADLLESRGCCHPELIAHCRELSGHLRGCWALDYILGKE